MQFPVSGVECSPFLPPLVSFVIAVLVTPAGLSGAFLLLPFQMSVLGFVSPAVSPTNLIYNVVAIPGGVYRYLHEKRMAWPLAWVTMAGTLPGVFLGAIVRIRYLPGARECKFFVGCVLLYLGVRLLCQWTGRGPKALTPLPLEAVVKTTFVSWKRIEYTFWGGTFSFRPSILLALSLAVGLIGGIYGVGGGAIIAPFVVAALGLPVHTIAGATLLGTFVTSIAGVVSFELLGRTSFSGGWTVRPDWALGALFGVGGLFGTYAGARIQRYLPERWIRLFLGILVTGVGVSYIAQFFIR
jgi:uncharacterized membrane protein YfcA